MLVHQQKLNPLYLFYITANSIDALLLGKLLEAIRGVVCYPYCSKINTY